MSELEILVEVDPFTVVGPVPVEVMTPGEVVRVPVPIGRSVTVTLEPGRYTCRAVLPNGAVLARDIDLPATGATVTLGEPPAAPLPIPPGPTAAPSGGPPTFSGGDTVWYDHPSGAAAGPLSGCWAALWTWTDGSWQPRLWSGSEGRPEADRLTVRLSLPAGTLNAVQIGAPHAPARVIVLPPSHGPTLLLSAQEPRGLHGAVHVEVRSGSDRADNLLAYVNTGLLRQAEMVATWVDAAEDMLQRKVVDQAGAAVAGYFLLLGRRDDRMHDWPANFATWYPWLPDALIIRAAQLRGRARPAGEYEALLAAAVAAGPPVYTQGLRAAYDTLQMLSDVAGQRSPALDALRPYAMAVDWDLPLTTYWATDPNEPRIDPRTGRAPASLRHARSLA